MYFNPEVDKDKDKIFHMICEMKKDINRRKIGVNENDFMATMSPRLDPEIKRKRYEKQKQYVSTALILQEQYYDGLIKLTEDVYHVKLIIDDDNNGQT